MEDDRTYTISEAARLVGMTSKALRRRVERGTMPSEVGVRPDGKPVTVIRASSLVAAHLLQAPPDGEPPPEPPPSQEAVGKEKGGGMAVDATLLVRRLEELAGELATHRLLASQAQSREASEARALEAAQSEVIELRAAETTQRQRADAAERRADEAAGQVERLTRDLEQQ